MLNLPSYAFQDTIVNCKLIRYYIFGQALFLILFFPSALLVQLTKDAVVVLFVNLVVLAMSHVNLLKEVFMVVQDNFKYNVL